MIQATDFTPLQVPTTQVQFHMSLFACRLHLCAAKELGTYFIGESVAAQSFFLGQITRDQTGEGSKEKGEEATETGKRK
jgi:hypothetical protein